ncbi:ABC transporter ATP-binding protein/permease [Clostridium sp. MSJ-8]|uniref:ABC transporter ATP-binding protein/permease n=1 Tax=Clostridium sp. MSJ-8 TaxID=2841510 RepID=UPI001C0F0890|nr:ABC transporter ATP-binding protein/permease [Clostridium sp. MSJ-8]MBU5487902.1 ABC transporter ATP-binding protein/permease [Clostridium sp. MSJ-8]
MLELKNIKKTYKIGDVETKALDDISVAFREKEFVAILGTSGSGKTTCLNIIGGLDRYDSGDLIIKGKKTKDFTEKDWDAYRNNSIGFVFQSYNLITHLSIVANVELGMTLSGVSKQEKHKRALEALEEVGLKDHIHKKPNQLSGGQMQRVAIARALANNPEILLCDEPTGALDTATSIQIMNLIKKIAKDKLVIMVTHNPELAKDYADRIIEFKDGKIIGDTHPHQERPKEDQFKLKKTSMSFFTALSLSFNNIRTKKGRTILTALASSIGIIGIALILSLSTGFQTQIDKYQSDTLSEMPIMISQSTMNIDSETMAEQQNKMMDTMTGNVKYVDSDEVYLYDSTKNEMIHENNFTKDYMNYVNNIDKDICRSIGYARTVNMNLVRKVNDEYKLVTVGTGISTGATTSDATNASSMTSMQDVGLYSYPKELDDNENGNSYLKDNYELVAGEYPTNKTDLVLIVDNENKVDYTILKNLGFNTDNVDSIKFEDIVGTELKLITNNDYYVKTQMNTYMPGTDYEKMYNSSDSKTLKVVGIARLKKDVKIGLLAKGIVYSDDLVQDIVDNSMNSDIVKAQKEVSYNIMSMEEMDAATKKQIVSYLGGNETPFMIMLYPKDFEKKDKVTDYLDKYNQGKDEKDVVMYTDLAATISEMSSGIMDAITLVLIAFAGISLIVSLIMISIITYTSVLERTKEIGILRALGARKKDITRVFDAETCILGVFSGVLGIVIAWACTFPINNVICDKTGLEGVANLQLLHAILLVVVSTVLTMLGGYIPAKMAAKKNAVEALRSE